MSTHECCTRGSIHIGEPTGTIINIAGLNTYKASSQNANGRAVLYIADAFGMDFPNNKLLADTYAEQAQVDVYVPDFFHGDAVPVSAVMSKEPFDFMSWSAKHTKDIRYPEMVAVATELREKHGVTKLAAIGFCWGAWFVITFYLD
jgi:dienelactone hydrolase